MALKIYWSKQADRKFDRIIEYLTAEWGERVTTLFVRKVFSFLDILSDFPEIGTIENKEKEIRGFTIVKQVNVFYTIKNDRIVLLNFFDNRQKPKKKRF